MSDKAVFSALIADGNTLSARFYSVSGETGLAEIDAGVPVRSAHLTDLAGNRIGDCAVRGTAVSAEIAPYAMAQIALEL